MVLFLDDKAMGQKNRFFLIIGLLIFLLAPILVYGKELPKLIIFYSPACHRCVDVENNLMPGIAGKFKGRIQIERLDISDIENYKFLLSLRDKEQKGLELILPVFYLQGNLLNSKGEIKIEEFILSSLNRGARSDQLAPVDLLTRFKSFLPLGIAIAGLEDGINPCAFTVIVFFISFLTLQGYLKRELALIGISFIFAVFVTYLLIGLGIFNFLYHLQGFWVLVKAINISVGILSILLGILSIYDFLKFKKSQNTEDLLLQLPKGIKKRIHSIIGLHYRRGKEEGGVGGKRHIGRLIFSAFITGFLVSLLEAVCTGQLYLPTIIFVFKATSLKIQALGYLLLYNAMFIVPLLIIFLFALLGVSSEKFSNILRKRLSAIKIIMAILFFSLGIFLLWKA